MWLNLSAWRNRKVYSVPENVYKDYLLSKSMMSGSFVIACNCCLERLLLQVIRSLCWFLKCPRFFFIFESRCIFQSWWVVQVACRYRPLCLFFFLFVIMLLKSLAECIWLAVNEDIKWKVLIFRISYHMEYGFIWGRSMESPDFSLYLTVNVYSNLGERCKLLADITLCAFFVVVVCLFFLLFFIMLLKCNMVSC